MSMMLLPAIKRTKVVRTSRDVHASTKHLVERPVRSGVHEGEVEEGGEREQAHGNRPA